MLDRADHVTLPLTQKEMHNKEILNRDELDEDEAKELLDRIRARL